MTASTILRDPAAHMGENVSMMAAVETVLSKTVFTVDQDKTKSGPQDLLIISPTLSGVPEKDSYVTVQGEVFKFDPAEVAKRAKGYTLDLSADLVQKYQGKPAVLATVVVTTALVDLAKKPIPPMNSGEQILSVQMKAIQASTTALRGGLDAPNADQLKEQVGILKKAFTEADMVFKGLGAPDAIGWVGDAMKLVTTMETAVGTSKWDDVKASAGTLQQLCTSCHTVHRERMDDGTYRWKSGG